MSTIGKIVRICKIIDNLNKFSEVGEVGQYTAYELNHFTNMSLSTVQRTLKRAVAAGAINRHEFVKGTLTCYKYSMNSEQKAAWLGMEIF